MKAGLRVSKLGLIFGVAAALWLLIATGCYEVEGAPHLGLGIRHRIAIQLEHRSKRHHLHRFVRDPAHDILTG